MHNLRYTYKTRLSLCIKPKTLQIHYFLPEMFPIKKTRKYIRKISVIYPLFPFCNRILPLVCFQPNEICPKIQGCQVTSLDAFFQKTSNFWNPKASSFFGRASS